MTVLAAANITLLFSLIESERYQEKNNTLLRFTIHAIVMNFYVLFDYSIAMQEFLFI